MSNNSIANAGSGGDTFTTNDLSSFILLSTTGKVPGTVLYVGADASTAPTGVTVAHPLPAQIRNSSGTELATASNPLQVSLANTAANSTAVKVDGSAVTQPVSGTFWQATQAVSAASLPLPSGAATAAKQPALGTAGAASSDVLSVQGIASMTALKVDGSAVTQPVSGTFWQATQPVSAASLPLPSGASTAAKQPALGTAGTASSDVLTVQGIASMTALKVDGSAVTQPVSGTFWQATQPISGTVSGSGTFTVGGTAAQGATASGNPVMVGGVFNTTQPTVTNGQVVDLQASARGGLIVATGTDTFNVTVNAALPAGSNVIGHAIIDSGSTTAVTQATGTNLHMVVDSGTVTTVSTVTNLSQMGGTAIDMNSGNKSAGTQRVVLATDQPTVSAVFHVDDNSASLTTDQARTASTVSAALATDAIMSSTTELTPKFAKISAASSGENTLVALVSAKKIRVLSLSLMGVGTAVSIYFKDGASGTAIWADGTNPIPIDKTGAAGAGGFVLPFNPTGWMQSASGAALILNLSTAQAVAGGLTYVEV